MIKIGEVNAVALQHAVTVTVAALAAGLSLHDDEIVITAMAFREFLLNDSRDISD